MRKPSLAVLWLCAGMICGCGGNTAPPKGAADADDPTAPSFTGGDIDRMRARHAELATKYTVRDTLNLDAMSPAERKEFVSLDRALYRFTVTQKLGEAALRVSDLARPAPSAYQEQPDTLESEDVLMISASGPWRCIRLNTENVLPVPDGWEIHEAGVESYLFFPPIEMTEGGPAKPDAKEMAVKFAVRDGKRAGDLRQSFVTQNQQTISAEGIIVGEAVEQFDGRGYFTVFAPKTGLLSVVAFTPIKQASTRGMSCLASAPAAKWDSYGPVLKTMLSRWHWEGGQELSVSIDLARIKAAAK